MKIYITGVLSLICTKILINVGELPEMNNILIFRFGHLKKNSDANYDLFYLSDRNILDASYIKLRDVSLSYKLPVSICRKIQLENVRVVLQVGNLWYWAAQ